MQGRGDPRRPPENITQMESPWIHNNMHMEAKRMQTTLCTWDPLADHPPQHAYGSVSLRVWGRGVGGEKG